MSEVREFKDIRGGQRREDEPTQPVDEFMADLEKLISETITERNEVWRAVADGRLSWEYLQRLAKEYYFLGRWYTAEFASLIANSPDPDAVTMAESEHFQHWIQNLADEVGYLGDPNHVDMKVQWARQLGVTDEELDEFVPLPETVGMVFTCMYYMRRSYEEGLAAFGWASERWAASTGYAKMMYEGMRDHYGIEVENFKIHAYAEEDHGDKADYLLRQVVTSAGAQRRVRRAIQHVSVLRNARTRALNAWLDEPGALRS